MPENIISTEFSAEMQQAYINYSMSVITARAVPDLRDGLKPVQRRVLYAMNELGLNADKPHRKSARIVGDAMGKYHPHGDSSIYEALVVLSQDFKKGMALIDGHGNFGSIEGDGAAAMRYTEARLKKFTQEVYLADLDKDVVDFVPNFDETEKEPEVLPVRVPNFLVNGAEGIAVGMTTSVPPHNLGEVIEGMRYLMDHPHAGTADLMQFIKGPDFPTGGMVINQSDLLEIYETGRGRIKLRGKAVIEEGKRKTDKDKIVITEIPYTMVGVNIGKFLSDVANLAETRKLPDIVDISNQSSKEGIKIVLELRKGADAEKILQGLYRKTKLEDTFGVNMLAIVDGKPEVVGLKRILSHNIQFQITLNTRKYKTLLAREQDKREVQEGLIQAVDLIDLIIELIRGSREQKTAKRCLMTGDTTDITFKSEKSKKQAQKLHFTERQAGAILDLRLSRLIGLEILALEKDYQETLTKIHKYEKILNDEHTMRAVIKQDLEDIRRAYALSRRTKVGDVAEAVYEEVPQEAIPVVVAVNRFGYIKIMEMGLYQKNMETILAENRTVFACMSSSKIGVFTQKGFLHQIRAQELPLSKTKDKGVPIDNVCNFDSSQDDIRLVCSLDDLENREFLFVTEKGMVKRVPGTAFEVTKKTVAATKLGDQDFLAAVQEAEKKHLLLISDGRTYLRTMLGDIPVQKKTAAGVRGMKLAEGQKIKAVYQMDPREMLMVDYEGELLTLTEAKLRKREARPDKF